MRTFGATTRGNAQLEGVIFGDGAVVVRRLSQDPCERITFTFEGVSECEAELDIKMPEPETAEGWTVYSMPCHTPARVEAGVMPAAAAFSPLPATVRMEYLLDGKVIGVADVPLASVYKPDDRELMLVSQEEAKRIYEARDNDPEPEDVE